MRRYSKKVDFNANDFDKLKISELKRMADYWLRQYLLSKANKRGNKIFCPLKKRWYSEDKIHVAHFIDRNKNNTRYSLVNCNLLSAQSNMWDSKIMIDGYKSLHHKEYAEWLGEEKVKFLLEESKKICIFARRDYVELIEKFRKI